MDPMNIMNPINPLNPMNSNFNLLMLMFEEDEWARQRDDDDRRMLEEMENNTTRKRSRHVGSVIGHQTIDRNRQLGHENIMRDYFNETRTYDDTLFRKRYRMNRPLFLRILNAVGGYNPRFTERVDAFGQKGCSPHQKITAVMRMLAYGCAADAQDEYCRIGKSTIIESLREFLIGVIHVFGPRYLRDPNELDISRLLALGESQGFPGMLGSIDCMHWEWSKCPASWHGSYTGHVKAPTIILEAVASSDLHIWHAFFGMPGSCNDINVLERSPVFDQLLSNESPPVNYVVNGTQYNMGYYLADGIYPPWGTLVKTIANPHGPKEAYYAKRQESVRKDVERAFGVLQARWGIIRGPSRWWDVKTMSDIMKACIIMHNMIVEDEGPNATTNIEGCEMAPIERGEDLSDEVLERVGRIRSQDTHSRLKADLIEHLWNTRSNDDNE